LASAAVLDASAVLAVLFNELGSDAVLPVFSSSLVSAVSLAEVHARLLARGADSGFAWRRLMDLGLEICPFDVEQAHLAGELAAPGRRITLSLGERASVALALARKATVYTADPAWKSLNLGISVEVIR